MGDIKISVEGYHCERCGYEWIPRVKNERPVICAKCKSARWDQKK